jgi:hypothetical protein
MSEALSTSSFPLSWAANGERGDDLSQTACFLFPEEEGPVVVRKSDDKREGRLENHDPVTSLPAETEPSNKSSDIAERARTRQTRILAAWPDQRYILLKKYEGFVTARREDSFSARLFESNSDYPVVEAEFDLEELSETDRELAIEGAPLVWTIGYAYNGSTRKRESLIYMRRLPPWGGKELEQGRKAADELNRAIRWE